MTTLLQRCQSVTTKVEQLTLAQRHASQQRQVQERSREWKVQYDRLKAVSVSLALLTLNSSDRAAVEEKRGHLRHNATEVLARLKSHDDIAQLTSDAAWRRLLQSVEGLAQVSEESGKSAWRSHIEEHGGLASPNELRNRAPSTPANDAALDAYKVHYGAYAGLTRLALPRSEGDLRQLQQLVTACRAEAGKITFDVPPDVHRFFQVLQSGGATLASVTPGVLEWLRENGALERYRIRSAA